jgi:23S rRNA (uracil1939-C5)-methyltransferase
MVVLVTVDPVFPSKNNFVKALRQKYPEISTVVLNINSQNTSMVLGERNIVLYGPGYIEDELCGCRFRISPNSFYQVNPVQTEILYRKAIEYAHLTGKEEVLDAYCGTGTIGIIASSGARKVTGVELNPDAIRDAVVNAKRNQRSNIRFIRADATEYMENAEEIRPDIVIMDPPRSGSTERFIRAVGNLRPERVVYVSCDPQTLARDLRYFRKVHYRAVEAQPVDLFPFTGHVETVCLLSKLSEARHHISVQVDMDELDLTAAESKATYEEIQEWVQEKYGFHVTHLNIAKTKRKCGIIERQNYNLPKSENSRSPETPKEKEEAIIDAFLHFKMI